MSISFIGELDDIAGRSGGYVDYCPDPLKVYGIDMTALKKYCQDKRIDELDLTLRERNMFIMKLCEPGLNLSSLPEKGLSCNYRAMSKYSREKGIIKIQITTKR